MGGELFKSLAKVDIVHVPYGGGPAMVDLLGGHVHMTFDPLPSSLPQSGRKAEGARGHERQAFRRDP